MLSRGLVAILVMILALAAPAAARADAYTDAVARFAADSYADTERAIEEVAASGNPLAPDVIQALAAGRLVVRTADKAVFLRDTAGGLRDARTGASATA